MKLLLSAILLCSGLSCSAQGSGNLSPTLVFYVMPCQLLPIAYSGGFTAGAEARVYHHFAVSAEAGRFYDPGYMAKVNFKYYLPNKDSELYYVAVELAYKKQSYSVVDNITDNSGTSPAPGAEVNYSVNKTIDILNLKYGLVALMKHSFYIDAYGGAGIRYRDINNNLAPGQVDNLYHMNEGFIDNFTNTVSKGYTLSLSLGIKIGFRYK